MTEPLEPTEPEPGLGGTDSAAPMADSAAAPADGDVVQTADGSILQPADEDLTQSADGDADALMGDAVVARRSAAWTSPVFDASPAGPTLSFGFNLAKVPDQGEDSDPIVRDGRDLGLVAVFDGMGGAGGTVYETPEGQRTGAYIGSRVARDVVEGRMLALLDPEWNLDGSAAARDLQRHVKQALGDRLTALNAPTSGLRSRLLRALPTTMALMALQRREPRRGRWTGHVLWSGDSRVYVFRPTTGASQLTRDDLRDRGDALVNLRQDSVVSNAMSADTEFVVHHHQVQLAAPFLAVAATDGCFGYVRTPIHFEHLVLAALRDSTDTDSWSALLQERITAITGDDAAMAVLGVGADHDEFRQLFAARITDLERRCIQPLDRLEAEVRSADQAAADARRRHAALQTTLWSAYKPGYEQHLNSEEGQ